MDPQQLQQLMQMIQMIQAQQGISGAQQTAQGQQQINALGNQMGGDGLYGGAWNPPPPNYGAPVPRPPGQSFQPPMGQPGMVGNRPPPTGGGSFRPTSPGLPVALSAAQGNISTAQGASRPPRPQGQISVSPSMGGGGWGARQQAIRRRMQSRGGGGQMSSGSPRSGGNSY